MLFALILACSATGQPGAAEADVPRGAGAGGSVAQEGSDPNQNLPMEATAVLEARSGSRMNGMVTFRQEAMGTTPGAEPGTEPGTGTPGTGTGTPGSTPGMGQPGMGEPGTMDPGTGASGMDPSGTQMGKKSMKPDMKPGMPPSTGLGQALPIQVSIRLVNAAPGNHAVFLHEKGDCSAPDASSAGGFYTAGAMGASGTMPSGDVGGTKTPGASGGTVGTPPSPSGELGSTGEQGTTGTVPGTVGTEGTAGPPPGYVGFVTVGPDGRGEKDMVLENYTLSEGAPNSIASRGLVVYEKAPDFTGAGDLGARQACGVIKVKEPGTLGTK